MSDATSAAPVATDTQTAPPGNTSEPVITREQTTSERVEADNAELDRELQAVLDKGKTNNDRAEKGRFAPKNPDTKIAADPSEKPEVKAETKTDAKAEKTDEKLEPMEKPVPVVKPPQSWPKEMAERFAKLDAEDQQFIAKREQEAHRTISQQGQQLRQFKPMAETLEKYRNSFERNGVTFVEGIEHLIRASDMLDSNPKAAIAKLAEQYKVDLFDLIDLDTTGKTADPAISSLQARLDAQEKELASYRREREDRSRTEQQATLQSFERIVEDFAKDKPDFDELEIEILGSIEAIRTAYPNLSVKELLQKAYDQAGWANPTTRAKRLETAEKERIAKARKEAEDAQKASSINVRSAHQANSGDDDLDEELFGILRKKRA